MFYLQYQVFPLDYIKDCVVSPLGQPSVAIDPDVMGVLNPNNRYNIY